MSRPAGYDACNEYTTILIDEALRRGIEVEVLDPSLGELRLSHDGVVHVTLESLSDLCSAVAYSRCEHKGATRRVLGAAGIPQPAGRLSTGDDADEAFLAEHGAVVVKPVRGEGGQGITVGVTSTGELRAAIAAARQHHPDVLLEALVDGEDLRVVVIDGAVVAAAVRRPPRVTGDGSRTIRQLIDRLNEERLAATGGASSVPLDDITWATVEGAGHQPDDVLAAGEVLEVRGTANVHTGGTITDVTGEVHPAIRNTALAAAEALQIPMVGIDVMAPDIAGPEHHVIEANAQAGLANHEPAPTAQRFIDLLFPATAG